MYTNIFPQASNIGLCVQEQFKYFICLKHIDNIIQIIDVKVYIIFALYAL